MYIETFSEEIGTVIEHRENAAILGVSLLWIKNVFKNDVHVVDM